MDKTVPGRAQGPEHVATAPAPASLQPPLRVCLRLPVRGHSMVSSSRSEPSSRHKASRPRDPACVGGEGGPRARLLPGAQHRPGNRGGRPRPQAPVGSLLTRRPKGPSAGRARPLGTRSWAPARRQAPGRGRGPATVRASERPRTERVGGLRSLEPGEDGSVPINDL